MEKEDLTCRSSLVLYMDCNVSGAPAGVQKLLFAV